MIEYMDGQSLDDVKTVMFTESDIKQLKYALGIQRNKCKRLALELRRFVRDRDVNGESYVTGVLERHEAVEKAQDQHGKLQRMIMAFSVWVPKD